MAIAITLLSYTIIFYLQSLFFAAMLIHTAHNWFNDFFGQTQKQELSFTCVALFGCRSFIEQREI